MVRDVRNGSHEPWKGGAGLVWALVEDALRKGIFFFFFPAPEEGDFELGVQGLEGNN